MLMGEEFHIATWPGNVKFGEKDSNGERKGMLLEGCTDPLRSPFKVASREYAYQSGSFVISVNGLLRAEDFEPGFESYIDNPNMNFDWAVGGSTVIDPFGDYVTEPVFNEDTIIYADCKANDLKAAKVFFDFLGHYSRPDAINLILNDQANHNLLFESKDKMTYRDLKNVSEHYEVPLQKIED